MKYCNKTTTSKTFQETKNAVEEALKSEGFGVLSEIDIQATIKKN